MTLSLASLLALPSVMSTVDVPWLPFPNTVDVVLTDCEPPRELTRTAFAVLLTPEGDVLMANNRRRGLEFPGGHIDAGESFEEAVRRECREECGVEPGKLHALLLQRMVSSGTVMADWKYPHPAGFQRFYTGIVHNAPEDYVENDECLRPVLLSRDVALSSDGPLNTARRVMLESAYSLLYNHLSTPRP